MVEEFREVEIAELADNELKSEQWKEIVNDLSLSHQLEFIESAKRVSTSPCPFTVMNTEMVRVYKTLCPTSVEVKDYKASPFPLRILEVIKECTERKYFHKLHVWYNETDTDPVLVGTLTDSWNSPQFIIARWGDELCSYVELKQRAIKKLIEEKKLQFKKTEREALNHLALLEEEAAIWINGEYVPGNY